MSESMIDKVAKIRRLEFEEYKQKLKEQEQEDTTDNKKLILNAIQYYLESSRQFMSEDAVYELKDKLEKALAEFGIYSW